MLPCFRRGPVQHWPSRVVHEHRHLGLDPEDLFSAIAAQEFTDMLNCPYSRTRSGRTCGSRSGRNCVSQQQDSSTTVSVDRDQFRANLDVQQFRAEEISVKVSGDDTVTVEARHEEKRDEHGFISRHFVRRYVLPEGYDINRVESKLSSDGVLTITAPKLDASKQEYRSIPVVRTGRPSEAVDAVEETKEEQKDDKSEVAEEENKK